jgi:MFS superfamily sulfate permease-like transporter
MTTLIEMLIARLYPREETGAIGALVVGIIVGVLLVIFGIIKFLIPGE